MRTIISMLLILTVIALAGSEPNVPISSVLMTTSQMAAAAGAGFWGGMACGLAAIATVAAAAAIITAIGGGTTVGIGVVLAFSAGAHIDAICMSL